MTSDNRRRIILAAMWSPVAFAATAMPPARAQAPRRRYGAHTVKGKDMLGVYADAVALMNDPQEYKEGDPRSWLFQWYTHSVRRDRSKASEVARIFPAPASSSLAEAVWDTCEAHIDPTNTREDFFLPWHRIYLHCFEDIVRAVSGSKDFTLPYWDYTTASRRALPEEFRRKGDVKWGSLYRDSRWEHANKGLPIDHQSGPAMRIDLGPMSSNTYSDSGGDAGFCANLDGRLHGAVHVNVGNIRGMGDVPWAASDPIFWLHHCNIDRIWSGWTTSGGKNPTTQKFLDEKFTFADGSGEAFQVTVADMLKNMEPSYDETPRRPPFPPVAPSPAAGAGRLEGDKPIVATPGTISTVRLGAPPQPLRSGPLAASGAQGTKGLGDVNLVVRLEGLTAAGPALQGLDVHVRSGGNVKLTPRSPSYLGSINFFGAGHSHSGDAHPHAGMDDGAIGKVVSLPIPDSARKLLDSQGETPELVFVGIGGKEDAQAIVRKVVVVPG